MSQKAENYDKIAPGCKTCNTLGGFLKYTASKPRQINIETIAEDTELSVNDLASKIAASGWDYTNDFTKMAPQAFKDKPSLPQVIQVMTTYSQEIRKKVGDEKVSGLLTDVITANKEVMAKRSEVCWTKGGPNLQSVIDKLKLGFTVKYTESGVIDTEATIASRQKPVADPNADPKPDPEADKKLSDTLKELIAGKIPDGQREQLNRQQKVGLKDTKHHLGLISHWQLSLDSLSKALPCDPPAPTAPTKRRWTMLSTSQKRKRLLRARHGASKWSSVTLFGA